MRRDVASRKRDRSPNRRQRGDLHALGRDVRQPVDGWWWQAAPLSIDVPRRVSGSAVPRRSLVIGASGFLGSHVARQLVQRGDDVRVMLRASSSTRAIDDLAVERCYGDIFDDEALRSAMAGCSVVFYCVVDARPWLRDPAPLWRTNTEGLRHVLDVAVEAELDRFVFTSSIGTIGLSERGLATEETAHNWGDVGGDYIQSRVVAEDMVLRYCRDRGLPGVAMCVANTYGPGDFLPTPHGGLVAGAVLGALPFYICLLYTSPSPRDRS